MNQISYAQMRILEVAKSFRRLEKLYGQWEDTQGKRCGYGELAQLLEEASGVGTKTQTENGLLQKKLQKELAAHHICLNRMLLYEDSDRRKILSLWVRMQSAKRSCVHAADLQAVVSRLMKEPYILAKGNRNIITVSEQEFVLEKAPKFFVLSGHAGMAKDPTTISGDCFTTVNVNNHVTFTGIADGMGTGIEAEHTSSFTMDLAEELFEAGFSQAGTMSIINEILAKRTGDDPVTIDLAMFDLYTGRCTLMKYGAASSFIKEDAQVKIIRPSSLPAGMLAEAKPDVTGVLMEAGQYLVMVSDGVLDALPFYDKEQHLAKIIDEIKAANPQKMAEQILQEALYYKTGENRDDMTVLVSGIFKLQSF